MSATVRCKVCGDTYVPWDKNNKKCSKCKLALR
jgi:uncharacterized OB-fold protein